MTRAGHGGAGGAARWRAPWSTSRPLERFPPERIAYGHVGAGVLRDSFAMRGARC